MNNRTLPHDARIPWHVVPLACVALLAGCQSYQPLPLDLAEHQADVASRLAQEESLRAFAERLADGDTDTDDPFDTSNGISSAEAEVIALFYNPDLRLARLRAGARDVEEERLLLEVAVVAPPGVAAGVAPPNKGSGTLADEAAAPVLPPLCCCCCCW